MKSFHRSVRLVVLASTVALATPIAAQTGDTTARTARGLKGAEQPHAMIVSPPANRRVDTGMVRRTSIDTTRSTVHNDVQHVSMPDSAGMPEMMEDASQAQVTELMRSLQRLMAFQMRLLADPVIHQRVLSDNTLRRQMNDVIATMSGQDTTGMNATSPDQERDKEAMPGMKMASPNQRPTTSTSAQKAQPKASGAVIRKTTAKPAPKAKTDSASLKGHGDMKMPNMPGMNMPATKKP